MNLILINGQLKYCKKTILYWKELALENNADVIFVCQPTVQYKDGTEEKVSLPWIKKNIPTASIFLIQENIHKTIKNQTLENPKRRYHMQFSILHMIAVLKIV